jgi:hypothetical protein
MRGRRHLPSKGESAARAPAWRAVTEEAAMKLLPSALHYVSKSGPVLPN